MRATRIHWMWLALGILAADRATKAAVEAYMPLGYSHTMIPGFFTLVHAGNPGIAFGLLADEQSHGVTIFLALATLLVCALLTWLLASRKAGGALASTGIAVILGGAMGNLYDRLLHSSVTDFLYFHLGTHYWPAFNLADSAITIGAVLVGIELIFHHPAAADQ
ncbi:MAG: signal peptidase II, partial [Bryobacteraceae bacterium]